VLFALDGNEDKVILKNDFNKYWKTLASVLTTDEVVAWAQHAQQLPSYIVAKFVENHVTGYDFPELLANNGELLEVDLNITKVSIKKRIMRGMRMILVGMSQAPPAPNGVTAVSKSCSEIMIKWDNSVKNHLDFPVHKYIIQRLVVQKHSSKSHTDRNWYLWEFLNQTSNASGKLNEAVPSSSASSSPESSYNNALHNAAGWITVFEGTGQDSFFEDHNLEKEITYRYRIISWNSVGHSSYVYIEAATVSNPCESSQFLKSEFFTLVSSLFNLAEFIFSYMYPVLFIIVMGILRLSSPEYKIILMDICISSSKFLSRWISYFCDVTNTLQVTKKKLQAEIEYGQKRGLKSFVNMNNTNSAILVGTGLRRNVSRDGFSSDGNEDKNVGLKRTGSNNSFGGNNSDDDNSSNKKLCYQCKKKFGYMRCRHSCSKCKKYFCRNCGRTTHLEQFSCKVQTTCKCLNCQIEDSEQPTTAAKENGVIGIALKAFRKGLKSRVSKTEFDGQTIAADESRNRPSRNSNSGDNYDIHQHESTNLSQPSCMGGDPHEGRPPRPTRRSAKG